jgi:hypothetical protein
MKTAHAVASTGVAPVTLTNVSGLHSLLFAVERELTIVEEQPSLWSMQ